MPTYDIAGVPIDFPFEAYELQRVYMEKVVLALERGEHALLESPTGTGKTLCLLCAALGWRRFQVNKLQASLAASVTTKNDKPSGQAGFGAWAEEARAASSGAAGNAASSSESAVGRLPRIIYTSRTHSQLKQVVKQLRMTSHKPVVCVLGSRDQMCVHPEVSQKHGMEQTACCQALVAAKSCSFHNELTRRKGPSKTAEVPHPDRGVDPPLRTLPDIEDFVSLAVSEKLCPFHWARELQHTADVLLLPYNYLVEPSTRRSLNINIAEDIIIFDEAHNVEKACAEAASFDLGPLDFAGAVREVDRVIHGTSSAIQGEDEEADPELGGAGLWLTLRQLILNLEQEIERLPLKPAPGGGGGFGAASGRFSGDGYALMALLGPLNITPETYESVVEMCSQAAKILMTGAQFGNVGSSAQYLRKIGDALRLVFDPDHTPTEYRLCVTEVEDTSSAYGKRRASSSAAAALVGAAEAPARTLGYWCQNPGVGMRALVAGGVRSVLLTSGTLSPLSSFALELGIPFAQRLENPHVISARQILVGVLPKGPSGIELTSTFRHRETDAYKCELGATLANVARLIPQGVLVFFPSYAALKSAHTRWEQRGADGAPSVLERLAKHKHVILEPRSAGEIGPVIELFRQHVATSERTGVGGAMLLAVCRGRLSEGVDFSDGACRGVVITGLPLPPAFDPKVQLKKDFLDTCARSAARDGGAGGRLSGEEWYDQQAMRAINQAVGRVIRHVHDYGAVLLCESRFKRPKYVAGLSVWLRPHVRQFEQFGQASVALPRFFRNAAPDEPTPEMRRLDEARRAAAPPRQAEPLVRVDCTERARAPLAPAPAAPVPLTLMQALQGASKAAARKPQRPPLRPQQPATAAAPPPGAGATKRQRVDVSGELVAVAAPAAASSHGAGGAGTSSSSSSGGKGPSAKEVLAMAQAAMSKPEYDSLIAVCRTMREVKAELKQGGDAAAKLAPVKARAAALFAGGQYKEVAEQVMRWIPDNWVEDLRPAFFPPKVTSSFGALHTVRAKAQSGTLTAKEFLRRAHAALGGDAERLAAFNREIGAMLLDFKASGAQPAPAAAGPSIAGPSAVSASAGEVLLRIHGLFARLGLGRSIYDAFGRFVPADHATQWKAVVARADPLPA